MYHNIFQVSTEPFNMERQATADDVLAFPDIPMTRKSFLRASGLQEMDENEQIRKLRFQAFHSQI